MKKIVAMLMLVAVSAFAQSWNSYAPYSMNVTPSSAVIVPATFVITNVVITNTLFATNVWTTNKLYAAGSYVSISGQTYWCTTAGTSGPALPAVRSDGLVVDSNAVWRVVPKRQWLTLSNYGTGMVSLATGTNVAVARSGMLLAPGERWTLPVVLQSEIQAVTSAGMTNVVGVSWN